MIDIKNFTKNYGDFTAVNDVSIHVPGGSIAALVGPNGAGKTTTIRTLCGILQPTMGQISINGINAVDHPIEVKKQTAYVPDDPPLFASLTVWEHLMFTAQAYEVDDWEQDAKRMLDTFELTDKVDVLASELSRGMRQKVAICCASLYSPNLLLLDEPMTGLDPSSIRKFKTAMETWRDSGATLLISSHLLSLVEDLCDHLVLMQKGEVRFCGLIDDAKQWASEQIGNDSDASEQTLEQVFFAMTENESEPSSNVNVDQTNHPAEGEPENVGS